MEEGRQTVVVIAHRLSTIKDADIIAVVRNGSVVEQGTHRDLMQKKSFYFKLSQEGQEEPRRGNFNVTLSNLSLNGTASMSSFSEDGEHSSETLQVQTSHIEFHDVHFHYPSRPNSKIFRGLNLVIREGETIALVGPSGQGKSTIIQLLENFYHPTSGKITYHGADMRDINVDWLRNQFGLVSQEPTLFHTTIAENIRFGVPNATQADIERAAKAANAHDFIMSFPKKYETIVGATGSTQVSGGEKQRLAIARALIRKPKVLLLDEATSALDNESERIVQDALDKIMADSSQTTIVIAHRLSTIKHADRIAFIDRGKVCEIGSHAELMIPAEGLYKNLQSLQSLASTLGSHAVKPQTPKTTKTSKIDTEPLNSTLNSTEDEESVGDIQKDQTIRKARLFSEGNFGLFCVGSIGAILAGLMFPGWGFIFAYMIELLYRPILPCTDSVEVCREYWNYVADDMQALSLRIAFGLLGVIASAVIGNSLVWYGFGTASERINKRVRDAVFKNLLRQEISWFDIQSVGSITSRVSEDAALMHTFSGEPIRILIMNLSSVFVGIVISFVYMW
jgi:ATP-binding cassette subfamily B (MDR/TAP) protein 1